METFLSFLRDRDLTPRTSDRSGGGSSSSRVSLEQAIDDNFCLLNDGILRELIGCAIARRNEQLSAAASTSEHEMLGPWGEIIDVMKTVLAGRQTMAGKNFERVLELGRQGDKKGLTAALTKLYSSGFVDYLFKDIVKDTLSKCQQDGLVDFVAMLQYILAALEKIESISKAKLWQQQQQELEQQQTEISSSPAGVAKAAPAAEPEVTFSGPVTADSSSDVVVVADATATISSHSEGFRNGDEEVEDDDDDTECVDSDDAVTNDADQEIDRFTGNEVLLIETNDFLESTIRSSGGDAKELKLKIVNACRSGQVDTIALLRVLKDNILACERAQYNVKLKLLVFIKDFLYQEVYGNPSRADSDTLTSSSDDVLNSNATTHHAPKFVDSNPVTAAELEILFPTMFMDGSQCKPVVYPGSSKVNKKKKRHRKLAQDQFAEVAAKIALHYEENGWAVCDNFLPAELVHQIRIEAGLFTNDYEQSEIWVGKQADVGAHLVVPSVRGDKVLWMCGHHDASPEGVTRAIGTYGEIEPCRLDIKAKAPLRRFQAMKQVAAAMNNFVDSLKQYAPTLAGIYERSDCMLAIYPGNGARFARHIDNTTKDGRRLTVLIYLNPSWSAGQGGCLRLTPPSTPGHAVDILPVCGRMALFSSADMAHEVMPTYGDRHSLTIWYYDKDEREQAILKAKEAGHAEAASKTGIETQKEAKAFIAELMGGDEVGVDGGNPTSEDLHILAEKVRSLSTEALRIVSNITGAPSEDSFRTGFDMLTPTDLKSMRQLFRRMGLQ
jgi:Rps23 Pro-64 3,4-dihydroxylase Tpa1-like proline 4-hydroxylase